MPKLSDRIIKSKIKRAIHRPVTKLEYWYSNRFKPWLELWLRRTVMLLMVAAMVYIIHLFITQNPNLQDRIYQARAEEIVMGEGPEPPPPILTKIAKCESGNTQYDKDGKVLKGRVDSMDTGKYQISKRYWSDEAQRQGYNIDTEEGNEAMAKWILNNRGTVDWSASQRCWNR